MSDDLKKYVSYDSSTYEFLGFYTEGRKNMPSVLDEVDATTYLDDKGQHTHYNPSTKEFYTPQEDIDAAIEASNRGWRDKQLVYTDKYLISDYPISTTNLELVKTYRQELRDYPDTWVKPTAPVFMAQQ